MARGGLRLREWSASEFAAARVEWVRLLERSSADRLFMSWEWQWAWWKHMALRADELRLIAAYACDGRLIGVAPLYRRVVLHRGLAAKRLESIGSSWHTRSDVFSEYLDFIVERGWEEAFCRALDDYLHADSSWSDLVLRNVRQDGVVEQFVREYLGARYYVRKVDPIVAQSVVLPPSFEDYLRALKGSVRRRIWNQRKHLVDARLHHVSVDQIPAALDALNDFHARRWGGVQYAGRPREFHLAFAALMAASGCLQITELRSRGDVISVLYNVRIGGAEYNLQSGFKEGARGISPGYLHFGYCMEAACRAGVRRFDFLAGIGLRRDYKADFETVLTPMHTVQIVRPRVLSWMYRTYDRYLGRPA